MKKIIGVFAIVVATSLGAQACGQFEAQFIGTVAKIVTTKTSEACLIQVNFKSFESSIMCPLDISEAQGVYLKSTACNKKIGDAISGVVINKGDLTYIE